MKSKKLNYENSKEASVPVGVINQEAINLDIPYLENALKKMEESHSTRMSASVLDPNPLTLNERMDLEVAKLNQLRTIIELGKNAKEILKLQLKLSNAQQSENKLKDIFNL